MPTDPAPRSDQVQDSQPQDGAARARAADSRRVPDGLELALDRPRAVVPSWLADGAALAWRFLLVVAALWLILRWLVFLRVVVLPVIVAVLLTALLAPPAQWLRRHRWPAMAATWAVLGLALLVLLGVVGVLVPAVTSDLPELRQQAAEGIEEVRDWLAGGPFGVTEERIQEYLDRGQRQLSANASRITQGAISGVVLIGEVVAGILLTAVLLFFFIKDGDLFGRFFLDLAGGRRADDMRALASRISNTLTGYIRGVALVGLVDASLIGLGLLVLGVPFVVPLAVLTFFGAFLPLIGAVVAGALAALVALVAEGPVDALLVVAITVGVQQVEGDLVAPLVLGRAVRLHPVVILLALAIGAVVGGLVGAFLSVPVAGVLVTIWSYYRERDRGAPPEVARQPGTEVAPGQDADAGTRPAS